MSTATVQRWTFGAADGERVFDPKLENQLGKVISFTDLIQIRSVRLLRVHHGIPLPKIREAWRVATEEYKINEPLAHNFKFGWFDGAIILNIGGNWLGLTGKDRHQAFMSSIVKPNMRDLKFAHKGGIATRWTPMESREHTIVIDPKLRFGQPVVMPGAINAESLARAVVTEGSVDAAAKAFDVEPDAVDLAWRYIDSVSGSAA